MDKKNESIIRILGRKAGLSSRALSKMLGIPISMVHDGLNDWSEME